jgi:hypothetical protein
MNTYRITYITGDAFRQATIQAASPQAARAKLRAKRGDVPTVLTVRLNAAGAIIG